MQQRIINGVWWLPDDPSHEFAGALVSGDHGLELSLVGTFNRDPAAPPESPHSVVHGLADSKLVTLFGCNLVGKTLKQARGLPNGRWFTDWSVASALLGANEHFAEMPQFSSVSFSFSYLTDWLGISNVDSRSTRPNDPQDLREMDFYYREPEPIRAVVNLLSIEIYSNLRISNKLNRHIVIHDSYSLFISSDTYRTVDDWLSHVIEPLRDFMNFASTAHNQLVGFVAYAGPAPEGLRRGPGIEVLHSLADHGVQPIDPLPSELMLLPADEVLPQVASILDNWLSAHERYREILDLFLAAQSSFHPFPYYRFLSLVQALESFHRRHWKATSPVDDMHLERLRAIYAVVPSAHRKWLKWKLKHSHEPSLQDRLIELTIDLELLLVPLIGDLSVFLEQIVATRNYLTHYDVGSSGKAIAVADLGRASDILAIVMRFQLLKEVGITTERSFALIAGSGDYQLLTSQWSPRQHLHLGLGAAEIQPI